MSDDRVIRRASHLLPEELAPEESHGEGVDPEVQASALLAESDLREAQAVLDPGSAPEHRTSEDAAR